jgi:hypothetical protein
VQVAITLLAARYQNAIPNQFGLIKKVASLDCKESEFKKALDFLSSQNFIEIHQVNGLAQDASSVLAKCSSEAEQSRDRAEQSRDISLSSKLDVDQVFEHWKVTFDHPKASLDAKRSALIKRALKGYSVADLCASISGYRHSPHHMGQNERQTVYDAIELFLRDAEHIDKGLRFAEAPPPITSELTNHNVRVLQNWRPADEAVRHAEVSGDSGEFGGGIRQAALPATR